VAGVDPTFKFDLFSLAFDLSYSNPPSTHPLDTQETLIFLPAALYADGTLDLRFSDGQASYDASVRNVCLRRPALTTMQTSTLTLRHEEVTPGFTHRLRVRVSRNVEQTRRLKMRTRDIDLQHLYWPSLVALAVALAAYLLCIAF
jgi:hypothetical protein